MNFAALTDLKTNGLPHAAASANKIQMILSIVIGIVGALCLLFITIGGFRYILSQGDPGAIAKAKGTIVYALVGLIVVILAEAIVAFVFGSIT
jgi:hypothetical protein